MAAITAVAAAPRFAALGRQSFWFDETVTADLLDGSFGNLLRALPGSESTPPLYYVLAWGWARVFGSGEAGLRSLSALVGVATVPAVYAAGRELVSHRTGLLASALAAVSPLLVWYSQEARAYALFVFFGALSLVFFGRVWRTGSRRAICLWAAASALAVLTHYFAIFLFAGEAVLLLYRYRHWLVYLAAGAVAASGIALLPLAAHQATHAHSRWIRDVPIQLRIDETVGQLLVPSRPSIWGGAGVPEAAPEMWPLGLALLACGSAAGLLFLRGRSRDGVAISLGLGVAAVVAPLVLTLIAAAALRGRGDVFLFRNVMIAWPPLTIAVAAGFTSPRLGRLGPFGGAALCAASAAVLLVNTITPHLQRDDWRRIAREAVAPGRVIVLSSPWPTEALTHYADGLVPLAGTVPVTEIVVVSRRWSPSYIRTVRRLHTPRGFAKGNTRVLQNWFVTVYRARTPRSIDPADLLDVSPEGASRAVLVTPTSSRRG